MTLKPEEIELLNPEKTDLLIIDMTRSYCDPSEGVAKLHGTDTVEIQEIVPRLKDFIQQARGYKVPIIWTKMIEDPDHVCFPPNMARKMRFTDTPSLSSPVVGWEYFGVQPEKGDMQIVKLHYNAFTGTDLRYYLKVDGAKTLVITGVYTSRCVDATAIVASDVFGYDVFVPRDLVGVPRAFSAEQDPILGRIDSIFGYVVNSQEILNAWASYK